MRRDQLNRRTHQTSAAAKAERLSSPQVIQRGRAIRRNGGGGAVLAYCKENAEDVPGNKIRVYLRADLAPWDGDETYAKNAWVEVAGTEYKSLQDDNTNHEVTEDESEWWEEGTLSVEVTCNISNGDKLAEALTYLNKGDPVIVTKIGGVWYMPTQFNGAIARI